jgi:hypothetical protein
MMDLPSRLANQAYGLIRAGMLDRGTNMGCRLLITAHPVACPEDPPSEMTIQFSLDQVRLVMNIKRGLLAPIVPTGVSFCLFRDMVG